LTNLLLLLFSFLPFGEAPPVDFNRDVRPILSQNCYPCHGPAEDVREAELRLDLPLVLEDERRILVPGSPQESELYYRVTTDHEAERMPPAHSNRELSAEQVDILSRWIQQGASYQDHWSFRPIRRPAVPPAVAPDRTINAIDRFIQARLHKQGRRASPPADRRTLLRRLSFDLTGMPATPAELRAFERDSREDAYERLVDRLLGSKPYAERMTLAWMDAARYGDSSVFHADGPRFMWGWRDWVIDAYHNNMPFDQFTVEQLAGDLLPGATRSQRIASGFHRNNGTSDEGGAIDEELRVLYMVDRVKTTGNVWLGLTLECAQCHAHKFDPVTQEDYYEFFAFFNQSREKGFQTRAGNEVPVVQVPDEGQEAVHVELSQALLQAESRLTQAQPPRLEFDAWLAELRRQRKALEKPELGEWQAIGPFPAASSKAAFETEWGPEQGIDWTADGGGNRLQVAANWQEDGKVHALELPDNSAIYLHRTLRLQADARRIVSLGSDDTLQVWLNGQSLLAKEVYRGAAADQDLLELDLRAGDNQLLLKVCNGGGPSGFYFQLQGLAVPDAVLAALEVAASERTTEQSQALREHFVQKVWPQGIEWVADRDRLRQEQTDLEAMIPSVMVMEDLPEGRMTYVLDRGQYDLPREDQPLQPDVLDFLLPLAEDSPRNRLGLAQWLVHPDHPLTARVAVNRYWAMLFGRGLVATVMDFGSQGEWPSHPELLDWLASEFISSGYNVQHILKRMVMSATYRQSSLQRSDLLAADPENRLLARAPRLRLQGEFLRDQALAVSGLLVDRVGGPSVKPYQPPGLWNEVSLDKNVRFVQDHGDKLYRKSMYIYWKRSAPMPAMTTFGAPTREKCVVQRQRTNTPLQALVTLNDLQFVEAARHLAERMIDSGGSFAERLDVGFELCTGRPADSLRRRVLEETYSQQFVEYSLDPASAERLLSAGESARDESLDLVEHATWTVLASMLLNLDETLNRE
jgi:hypothetical protein